MEGFEALLKAQLVEELGRSEDDDSESIQPAELLRSREKKKDNGSAAIRLLYDSSRQWMFRVADYMTRGMIRDGRNVECVPNGREPELPETEVWDFQLGDTVKIKYSREDFKWIQQKTLGWNDRLHQIYSQVGIINKLYTKHDNSIGVYFPNQLAGCTLYAGLLKKVNPPQYPNLNPQWKVGDFVQTISCKKTLKLLQRGLDQIPEKLIGVKGRVVAVTHPCTMVTFNERKTHDLSSASLVACKDESTIIKKENKHARGITVGEVVKVKSNVKKLIENQKGFGNWDSAMCRIIGKEATVIHIQEDGALWVQAKHTRTWKLNPDSVLRSGEDEFEEKDLKFRPGDIIKLKAPINSHAILAMAEVPMVFLEYMRSTAILSVVDDDLDYLVSFNAEQNVQTDEHLMRNATELEKQTHETIAKRVKELKAGDKVHLDVGPPNYVQAMIKELELEPTVAMAMVNSATLIGFINPYTAIIEYENGVRFRVKKKYLTVPEKFYSVKTKASIKPSIIPHIYDAITKSVQAIHSEKSYMKDWKVDVMFMSHGNPPCVEYKIESPIATFDDVCNWFNQHSEWDLEALGDRQFILRGTTESDIEIKVGIIFNEEKSISKDLESQGRLSIDEEVAAKNGAVPIRENNGARIQPNEERPQITSVDDFNFIKLFDPLLAKNVYFPYIVRGPGRTPAMGQGVDHSHQTQKSEISNTYNIVADTVDMKVNQY